MKYYLQLKHRDGGIPVLLGHYEQRWQAEVAQACIQTLMACVPGMLNGGYLYIGTEAP